MSSITDIHIYLFGNPFENDLVFILRPSIFLMITDLKKAIIKFTISKGVKSTRRVTKNAINVTIGR